LATKAMVCFQPLEHPFGKVRLKASLEEFLTSYRSRPVLQLAGLFCSLNHSKIPNY
jgi:hypothetical protein